VNRQLKAGRQRGLTLIDALLVVVIVAIVSAYAVMRVRSTGENTLWYQAQQMASDIRHVQVLASTYGRSLQITASAGVNGTYTVSCVSATTAPCPATLGSAITDPVTGSAFTGALQDGVTLAVSGTNPLPFDMQGRPLTSGGAVSTASTTYTLTVNGTTATITVSPITGFVGVSP
jgi:Tfp pilus assembly protein FimT